MDKQDAPAFYGEWLKQRRKTLDLTQAELAQRAGCSVFALRKIESGERRPSKQLAHLLAAALGIPPEDEELFTRVARGEAAVTRLDTPGDVAASVPLPASAPVANLPAGLPPLLGRESELAAISRLLHDPLCRLLTLIGAGGIGKTRLAIEAAARHHARFAGDVFFVSLAPLTSPALLVPTIADSLGLAFHGQSEPRAHLLDYLAGRQMLLVLDNIEHLLDGVPLLADIVARAPQVKLLVTSRERLNLQSEWVTVVQGLPVPPAGDDARVEDYASVQLFVQSARRARTDFVLHETDHAAVVDICRMVEGMPLGIELAAAWVALLDCGEIAREIAAGLDFLATGSRGLPERQRSLRAVFDHSWNLLTPDERGVLSRLAIFQGGFGRDAAEQVAGATLPALLALTSKSLLRRNENGRYDLHEVVRQYAFSHLTHDPARAPTHEKHGRFYLSLLRDRETDLKSAAQRDAIRSLKDEIDNIRAAWSWAIEHEYFEAMGQALRSLGWLCNVGVLYGEGIEQIERLVQVLRARTPAYAGATPERQRVLGMALAQQGLLYFRLGLFDSALDRHNESLALLRPLHDPALLPDPLVISGVILHLKGEIQTAQARVEEGLACAREAGDRSFEAYALYNLGYIASLKGRYHEGYEQMLDALALWRALGDPSAIALGLNYISPTALHLGRVEEAQAFLHESLELLAQVGDRWGMGTAYRLLGAAVLAQGDTDLARSYLHRSLDLFRGYITGWDVAQTLTYLGETASAAGDFAEAQRIFQEALDVVQEHHATPLLLNILVGLAQLQLHERRPEHAWRLAHVVMGHPAATHEAKERAACLGAQAEARLAPEQINAATQWAADDSPDTVLDMLIGDEGCAGQGDDDKHAIKGSP